MLRGGILRTGGEDVIVLQKSLKSKNRGIAVGPDFPPDLSFTSGNEGRAKGVSGRQFSFLSNYQPWIRDAFNPSKNDRFNILSEIAHDPIQRDIFTPLCLGVLNLIHP